jgi:hypothetical protein
LHFQTKLELTGTYWLPFLKNTDHEMKIRPRCGLEKYQCQVDGINELYQGEVVDVERKFQAQNRRADLNFLRN